MFDKLLSRILLASTPYSQDELINRMSLKPFGEICVRRRFQGAYISPTLHFRLWMEILFSSADRQWPTYIPSHHFSEEKSSNMWALECRLWWWLHSPILSLAARAEVLKLFSVEKELLSSHSNNLNSQLLTDSPSSLKTLWLAFWTEPMLSN